MDAELEFAIQSSTTGKQLFDQVGSSTYMTCFTVCFIMCFCYSLLYAVVSQYMSGIPYTDSSNMVGYCNRIWGN